MSGKVGRFYERALALAGWLAFAVAIVIALILH